MKHTILCLWRARKTQIFTLADYITIPRLRITLQFHARGDNTKHTVPRWWRQYRAQHSAFAETT